MKAIPSIIGAALLAGCAANADVEPAATADRATAGLRDAQGRVVARGEAIPASGGVRVQINADGLAPGTYGAHVHQTGRCDPPSFESAGPHWNPTRRLHGSLNPQGPHAGDLPNLSVGTDSRGTIAFTAAGGTLGELLDEDGAAIVVHAHPDDYRTDPSGNSGARIACGVLG